MHPSVIIIIIINNHRQHIPDNGHTAADRSADHRRDKTNSDSSTSSPRYVLPSLSSPSSLITTISTYLTTVTLQQTGLQTTDETKLTATAAPVLHATSFHYHHHHHHHVHDNGHTAADRSADHRRDKTNSDSSTSSPRYVLPLSSSSPSAHT